ncbi:MAG: PrsW family intramembrane metalloprotease [Clostridiales bacterium]|nr:PrsW family intramembrane metalloprotease [Clostridiales bacterium]
MLAENYFLCMAAPLAVALLFVKGGARRFCTFFLAGLTMCLLSAYVGSFLVSVTGYSVDDAAVYITPISEELMKMMPLLFYYLVFEPEDKLLLSAAAAVGAGFATFENSYYLLSIGSAALDYVLIRGLAVGVMHTICSMAVPMVLILFHDEKHMNGVLMTGMTAVVVTYHGLYNLLVSVPGISRVLGYGLPLCTVVGILVLVRVRKKILAQQL